MTNTPIIEEYRSPVLEQLSPALEKQVAEIIEAAEVDAAQDHVEEEATNTLKLSYSVPMPGVRYYAYL